MKRALFQLNTHTMKLKILHFSLLFAATTAKDVYVEGATTDSPGAAAVVPAAKLGSNESAKFNYEYDEDAATDSPGAEAVVPAAKLNGVKNETLAANHRRTGHLNRGTAECVDTDYGAVDSFNDACSDYNGNTHWCGNYDAQAPPYGNAPFISNTMCCACGGGARQFWAELKNNHVDGCRRGTWGWLYGGCALCEGDCDKDSDCMNGLRCFKRDGITPVPFCKGTGKPDWDYCVPTSADDWLWFIEG